MWVWYTCCEGDSCLSIPLPLAPRNALCRDCDLHTQCRTVCIPSRPWQKLGKHHKSKALFVIGEAPGMQEDDQGSCFVGKSGELLHNVYLNGIKADSYADVFLGNVVRCRPPQNRTPVLKESRACAQYWLKDLELLRAQYEEVVILCVGASSAFMVGGHKSLAEALRHQGAPTVNGQFPTFYTNHPAHCLRDDSRLFSVVEHLYLLREYLETGTIKMEDQSAPKDGIVLKGDRVAFDIETYGLFQGRPNQTAFHPKYAEFHDKVPVERQIESVSASNHTHTGYYIWRDRKHRDALIKSLMVPRIDGMNICFDLSFVRAAAPAFRSWMDKHRPLLVDLSVVSFVECDARAEKSLKALSPLFRASMYAEDEKDERGKKVFRRYPSPMDAEARAYNCQDAASTFSCIDESMQRLDAQGRKINWRWWSDVMHLCLFMSENGVRFNRAFYQREHDRRMADQARWAAKSKEKYGKVLEGKGTIKDAREMANKAAHLLPAESQLNLERTEKKQEISINDANREVFLERLPKGRVRSWWRLYDRFVRSRKITSSVTSKMLSRHMLPDGIVHPIWKCVPTHAKDGLGDSGGQRQGRLSPKPGLVTFPRQFLNSGPTYKTAPNGKLILTPTRQKIRIAQPAIISRFPGGSILHIDLSQIELRVAAHLSGDPLMIEEYNKGIDRHWARALELYGENPVEWAMGDPVMRQQGAARHVNMDDPAEVRNWLRQGGKHPNFLILYLGGADILQMTILKKVGMFVSYEQCVGVIEAARRKYARFNEWQQEQIAFVARHGYLDAPPEMGAPGFLPTGLRRTWAMGACDPDSLRIAPEVVNFKVQYTAATMMLAAQIELHKLICKRELRTVIAMNHYDACDLDTPPDEVAIIRGALGDAFLRNPYIKALEAAYGRPFPLKDGDPDSLYEVKINGEKT